MPESMLQVTELGADVVAEICHIIDPQGHLFGGRVSAQSAVMEAAPQTRPGAPPKKRPVRRLRNVAGAAQVAPAALVLDSKTQMLWDAAEARHVLHCERYPYFPRVSQVRGWLLLRTAAEK